MKRESMRLMIRCTRNNVLTAGEITIEPKDRPTIVEWLRENYPAHAIEIENLDEPDISKRFERFEESR